MRCVGFMRTWTVSLRFPLLSFSLESVVGLLTWSVCDLDRSRQKLGAKVMKSHGLEKELDEVKASLLKESDEHDTLRTAV